jgi:hypothetical protein
MSSLPTRGTPNLGQRIYEMLERFAPWRYTGIYSSPEFKSHVPVVSAATRIAPTNPPFSALLTRSLSTGVGQRLHKPLSVYACGCQLGVHYSCLAATCVASCILRGLTLGHPCA